MTVPTIQDVERIAGMPDPVLRNLHITACYHELSAALCERSGAVANWCTFATWASRQAGRTIRGEDLRHALAARLARVPALNAAIEQVAVLAQRHPGDVARNVHAIRALLASQPALARAAAAVARGNLKVFDEIGREFARYLTEGVPPREPPRLHQAFTAYTEALATTEPARRSQLVLLANLLIGFHEQQRLQPEIREALDTARAELERVRPLLISLLLPGWWQRTRRWLAALVRRPMPLDAAIGHLLDEVCAEIRELLTAELMTLQLPAGELRLGHNMPDVFPPSLRNLDHAPLLEFLSSPEIAPAAPRADERDWSDFPYRMFFIAKLFRSYQERTELLNAPFSEAQLAELRAGRRPPPPL